MKQLNENTKYRICHCRKCDKVFNLDEAKQVETNLYNIKIKEKRCPVCEGQFRILKVKDLYEVNRDHWILHNPASENEIANWEYYNRENQNVTLTAIHLHISFPDKDN